MLCGVVPAGERAGAGSSDFDVFAVYDDPRLGPDEVRLQTTVRWMVDHTGGVSLLTTAQRGWDALTTSCDTQVQFEGYRLNLFHTSATCYYVMGRKAEEVLDVIRGLDQRRGAGELELTAEERGTLMQDGEGLILHPAYYFQETPSFFDDDTTLVWKRRDGESHYETALDREGLALFHRLLPALASNTVSLSTLRERLDDEEWEFLQRMLHHGYVVPAPLRAPAVRRDHRLTLIGHSGIVFESPSSRVMLDPLFLVRARRDYNPIPAVLSEPLDAVIISHPHWGSPQLRLPRPPPPRDRGG
ncbi:MAG: hypothetical protein IPO67_28490 [Deltaproteobacteria bacterium]|nr:hypothetical protein [Deltaproteobacteria bacterium]